MFGSRRWAIAGSTRVTRLASLQMPAATYKVTKLQCWRLQPADWPGVRALLGFSLREQWRGFN